jgi:DNA polymerase
MIYARNPKREVIGCWHENPFRVFITGSLIPMVPYWFHDQDRQGYREGLHIFQGMISEGPGENQLESIAREIRACRQCPLWENTRQAVPGEGAPSARVFFIGEAPGEKEDQSGRPFVGRAGKLLDRLILGAGLTREEVFIGNVIRHRPPGNRDPHEDEIAACAPYLDRQLAAVRPYLVVTLGRHSARYILGKAGVRFNKITEIRGSVFSAKFGEVSALVMPTLHPAAALYSPRYRIDLEADFLAIRSLLKDAGVHPG